MQAKPPPLRIALVHEVAPAVQGAQAPDLFAEFERADRIEMLASVLEAEGHTVHLVDSQDHFAERLLALRDQIDLVFNYSVGFGHRSRETLVPAVCTALGIPFTGTDAMGLALGANKHATKLHAAFLGIATPPWAVVEPGGECPVLGVERVIVKPVFEGTSIGLFGPFPDGSPEAADAVLRAGRLYGQAVMVEAFIPGREATVLVMGNDPPKAASPLVLAMAGNGWMGDAMFTGRLKKDEEADLRWGSDDAVPKATMERMQADSIALFKALGCQDLARTDFRIDGEGRAWLLETNAVLMLTDEGGAFRVAGEREGVSYAGQLQRVLASAWQRYSQNQTSLKRKSRSR